MPHNPASTVRLLYGGRVAEEKTAPEALSPQACQQQFDIRPSHRSRPVASIRTPLTAGFNSGLRRPPPQGGRTFSSGLLVKPFDHNFGNQSSGSEGTRFAPQSRDLELNFIR